MRSVEDGYLHWGWRPSNCAFSNLFKSLSTLDNGQPFSNVTWSLPFPSSPDYNCASFAQERPSFLTATVTATPVDVGGRHRTNGGDFGGFSPVGRRRCTSMNPAARVRKPMLYPLSYGAWVQLTGSAAIWRGRTRQADSTHDRSARVNIRPNSRPASWIHAHR